jgi:hypothetical protein
MRRWWVALGAGAVLLAAWFLWRARPAERESVAPPGSRARPAPRLPVDRPISFAWVGQPGIAARRVAGRVVHDGNPVPRAAVRLATRELLIGEHTLRAATTGDDGRFEFRGVPALRYNVVAQAEGLAAGYEAVDLRLPEPAGPRHKVSSTAFMAVDIVADTYDITATTETGGFASARATVVAGAIVKVTLSAAAKGKLTVRAVGWKTGQPVPDAWCYWTAGSTSSPVGAPGKPSGLVPATSLAVHCGVPQTASLNVKNVTVEVPAGGEVEVTVEMMLTRAGGWPRVAGLRLDGLVVGEAPKGWGLEAGDSLTAIDGHAVADFTVPAVLLLLADREPGAPVRLTVSRGGQEKEVSFIPTFER